MRNFEAESIIENIRLDKNNPHMSACYFLRLMKVNIITIICGVFYAIIQSNHSPAGNLPAGESFLSLRSQRLLCNIISSFNLFTMTKRIINKNSYILSIQPSQEQTSFVCRHLPANKKYLLSALCASAVKKFHLVKLASRSSGLAFLETAFYKSILRNCHAQT